MKKILGNLLLIFLILSCSQNEYEKRLIGTWNSYPTDGRAEIRFYADSVISFDLYHYRKGTWNANGSQIKLHFPKKLSGYHSNLTLDYKLSKNNDSLLIKNTTDSIYIIPVLLKVDDVWKHYLKGLGLRIDLPKADFDLIKNDSMYYGINLYVGYLNNKIVMKSDDGISLDSSNFKYYVHTEKNLIQENLIDKLNFNIIVDKGISVTKIDSIKLILKEFPKMKIFRVYKNDTANYGKYPDYGKDEYWNWYGKYE